MVAVLRPDVVPIPLPVPTPAQLQLLADAANQAEVIAEAREAMYEAYLAASNFCGWCWVAGWTFGAVLDALGAL